MFPVRLSILTFNIWKNHRLTERKPSFLKFFQTFQPDIFCLQELTLESRSLLDHEMQIYSRVQDDFAGWEKESNIYWNSNLLEEVEHGIEDVGISSDEYRRLFWVRLKVIELGKTIFVSTAHYTHQEHPNEVANGQSPRAEQARRTVTALDHLIQQGEPAFFMGDLNDPVMPNHFLHKAGYRSCFSRLGILPPPTWPSLPTANLKPMDDFTNQTIDWLVSNDHARPLAAEVPHFYYQGYSPSDHWPVLAVYEV